MEKYKIIWASILNCSCIFNILPLFFENIAVSLEKSFLIDVLFLEQLYVEIDEIPVIKFIL